MPLSTISALREGPLGTAQILPPNNLSTTGRSFFFALFCTTHKEAIVKWENVLQSAGLIIPNLKV